MKPVQSLVFFFFASKTGPPTFVFFGSVPTNSLSFCFLFLALACTFRFLVLRSDDSPPRCLSFLKAPSPSFSSGPFVFPFLSSLCLVQKMTHSFPFIVFFFSSLFPSSS